MREAQESEWSMGNEKKTDRRQQQKRGGLSLEKWRAVSGKKRKNQLFFFFTRPLLSLSLSLSLTLAFSPRLPFTLSKKKKKKKHE